MDKKREAVWLTLLFFLYCFTYSMVHSCFNTFAAGIGDAAFTLYSYKLLLFFNTAGLIIFGLIRSLAKLSVCQYRRLTGVVTVLTIPLIFLYFATTSKITFMLIAYILTILIGGECIYIYSLMIDAMRRGTRIGIIYFSGASGAVIVQYLLQSFSSKLNLTLYSLVISGFIMSIYELSGGSKGTEKPNKSSNLVPIPHRLRYVLITLVIIICLELIGNFLTYSLLILTSDGTPVVYSFPRLFIILGYLVMGIMVDYREMKFLPIITFCAILLGTLNPVLFGEPEHIYVNTSIFYVVVGVINCFLTFMMWKYAVGSRFMPLIAVSGRIIDNIFSIIFISPILSSLPLSYTISLELFVIIFIILLLAFSGQLDLKKDTEPAVKHISPEEFAKRYNLTEKETEVFVAAIEHNGNVSELARSLYISRTVLYRHLGRICEKTGMSNLRGIRTLYFKTGIYAEAEDVIKPDIISNLEKETEAKADLEIADKKSDYADKKSEKIDKTKDASAALDETEEKNKDEGPDRLDQFAEKYHLTASEKEILTLFIESPGMTQQEMAFELSVTLRTVQRRLASIRTKTDTKSLPELGKLFYET